MPYSEQPSTESNDFETLFEEFRRKHQSIISSALKVALSLQELVDKKPSEEQLKTMQLKTAMKVLNRENFHCKRSLDNSLKILKTKYYDLNPSQLKEIIEGDSLLETLESSGSNLENALIPISTQLISLQASHNTTQARLLDEQSFITFIGLTLFIHKIGEAYIHAHLDGISKTPHQDRSSSDNSQDFKADSYSNNDSDNLSTLDASDSTQPKPEGTIATSSVGSTNSKTDIPTNGSAHEVSDLANKQSNLQADLSSSSEKGNNNTQTLPQALPGSWPFDLPQDDCSNTGDDWASHNPDAASVSKPILETRKDTDIALSASDDEHPNMQENSVQYGTPSFNQLFAHKKIAAPSLTEGPTSQIDYPISRQFVSTANNNGAENKKFIKDFNAQLSDLLFKINKGHPNISKKWGIVDIGEAAKSVWEIKPTEQSSSATIKYFKENLEELDQNKNLQYLYKHCNLELMIQGHSKTFLKFNRLKKKILQKQQKGTDDQKTLLSKSRFNEDNGGFIKTLVGTFKCHDPESLLKVTQTFCTLLNDEKKCNSIARITEHFTIALKNKYQELSSKDQETDYKPSQAASLTEPNTKSSNRGNKRDDDTPRDYTDTPRSRTHGRRRSHKSGSFSPENSRHTAHQSDREKLSDHQRPHQRHSRHDSASHDANHTRRRGSIFSHSEKENPRDTTSHTGFFSYFKRPKINLETPRGTTKSSRRRSKHY